MAMSLLFRGVEGIRLRARRAEGGTTPKKGGARLGTSSIAFVGYLGPSAFGLGAARLIETGHVIAVLWVAIMFLVLLLTLISVSFGFVSVPVAVVLLLLVMRYQHTGLEEFAVYLLTWLLLLSGARNAVGHGAGAGDAKNLTAATHLPRHLWALIWMAGTVLAVIIGGKWLILGS